MGMVNWVGKRLKTREVWIIERYGIFKGFDDKFISGGTVKNDISGVLSNFEIFDKLGIDPDDIGDFGQSLVKKDTIKDMIHYRGN